MHIESAKKKKAKEGKTRGKKLAEKKEGERKGVIAGGAVQRVEQTVCGDRGDAEVHKGEGGIEQTGSGRGCRRTSHTKR